MDLSKIKLEDVIKYGIIIVVAIIFLREVMGCDFKIPLLENFTNGGNGGPPPPGNGGPPPSPPSGVGAPPPGMGNVQQPPPPMGRGSPKQASQGSPQQNQVVPSELFGNEVPAPVHGVESGVTSCYPQNTLSPNDLLPSGAEKDQINNFNNENPSGEGILKGVNFLDAGFHVGVNTIGQSLRNANLNLRAEPPNPRVKVSPWMNTTIDTDLSRKSLDDTDSCSTANPSLVSAN